MKNCRVFSWLDEAQKFRGGNLYVGSSQVKSGHLAVSGCSPVLCPLWLKRSQGRSVYTTMVK